MKKALASEMEKDYQPKEVQREWYEWWVKQGYFKADASSNKEKFAMVIPPPNVTGKLHIGHALTTAAEDAITRYHRMCGKEVLWVPGTDHAGIATQVVVEKKLWKEQKRSRHDLGREAFIAEVWKWKEQYGNTILEQLRHMGASVDWSREAFTMDAKLSRAVEEAFIRLHEKGLIYRDTRLVNWSCQLKSAISNIEVDWMSIEKKTRIAVPGHEKTIPFGVIYEFAYQVVDGADATSAPNPSKFPGIEEIVVATTRPETIIGDTAVAIHPKDKRYTHLHGKYVWNPFSKKAIPIVTDDVLVDMAFGTGAVKVTPAHDPSDFACGKRHNLPMVNILNEDGTLNANAGQFAGLKRYDARHAVLEELKRLSLYKGEKDHAMQLAICSRSNDVLEPMLKPQWYVDTKAASRMAIEKVEQAQLKIWPSTFVREWNNWLSNPQDWCISRQLWWGHSTPAYYVKFKTDSEREKGDDEEKVDRWVIARNKDAALKKAAEKFGVAAVGDIELVQDPDVLDTWFSSALFPFSVMGWPDATPDLAKFFPTSLLETGHDILFFWVAKMVMMSLVLTDQLPFTDVFLHAVVRDASGEKMSKSKGNVIDPIDIIEGAPLKKLQDTLTSANLSDAELKKALMMQKELMPNGIPECGTDALRFALCMYTSNVRDINLDIQHVVNYRHFCNKLWNAARFVLVHSLNKEGAVYVLSDEDEDAANYHLMDEWILSRLASTVKIVHEAFAQYQLSQAANAIYCFWLYDFCDVYVEAVKSRINGEDAASRRVAQATLHSCMHTGLRLLHPFMPFITEELYQRLPKKSGDAESIVVSPYPLADAWSQWYNASLEGEMATVLNACRVIRTMRADYSLKRTHNPKVYLCCHRAEFETVMRKFASVIGDLVLSSGNIFVCNDASFGEQGATLQSCCMSTIGELCNVYMKIGDLGLDFGTEVVRQKKRANELVELSARLKTKTLAADYYEKVPKFIQDRNDERLKAYVAELASVENVIKQLGAMTATPSAAVAAVSSSSNSTTV